MPNRRDSIDRRRFLRAAARTGAAGAGLFASFAPTPWLPLLLKNGRLHGNGALAPMRPLEVVACGDSIMWGQGLSEPNKFTTKVVDWLKVQLAPVGRDVHLTRVAHSGAIIAPDGAADADRINTPRHGEIPDSYPSVTAQVTQARGMLSGLNVAPADVDLVLIDGGINDVNIMSILNPLTGDGGVRQLVRDRVTIPMRGLLSDVTRQFPKALVMVVNYFPIISEQSDLVEVGVLFGALGLVANVAISALLTGPLGLAGPVALVAGMAGTPALRSVAARQSRVFHEESTAGIQSAVNAVNRQNNVASVVFVDVGFRDENAYGMPDATRYLYRTFEPGDVYDSRAAACDAARLPEPDHSKCIRAQMGHPNPKGAQRYADAITNRIGSYNVLPRWRGERIPSICMDPPPSVELGQSSTTTVIVWDDASGVPLPGVVTVADRNFSTNQPFTHVFCRTQSECDLIRVVVPKYAVQVLDPRLLFTY